MKNIASFPVSEVQGFETREALSLINNHKYMVSKLKVYAELIEMQQ